MPQTSGDVPGRFFATDLRLIREKLEVSVEDVFRVTKIPVEIIQLFEKTGLLDHPRFNEVYLRSFVKEYARSIHIPSSDVLEALDQALAERYSGSLAKRFLHEQPSGASAPPPVKEVRVDDPPEIDDDPPKQKTVDDVRKPKEAAPGPPVPVKPSPPPPSKPTTSTPAEPEVAVPPSESRSIKKTFSPKDPATPGSRAQDKTASTRRAKTRSRSQQRRVIENPILIPILAIVGVLAIASAVLWLPGLMGSPDGESTEAPENIPTLEDSVQVDATPLPFVLPDSFQVAMVADGGVLEGIRLRVDGGLLQRRWVEEGDSLLFFVEEEFIVSAGGYLDRLTLRTEGVELPKDRLQADGGLSFSRDFVQQHIDQARGGVNPAPVESTSVSPSQP